VSPSASKATRLASYSITKPSLDYYKLHCGSDTIKKTRQEDHGVVCGHNQRKILACGCAGRDLLFVTVLFSTGRFADHRMTDTVATGSLGCCLFLLTAKDFLEFNDIDRPGGSPEDSDLSLCFAIFSEPFRATIRISICDCSNSGIEKQQGLQRQGGIL
jgi:hypothetical protein